MGRPGCERRRLERFATRCTPPILACRCSRRPGDYPGIRAQMETNGCGIAQNRNAMVMVITAINMSSPITTTENSSRVVTGSSPNPYLVRVRSPSWCLRYAGDWQGCVDRASVGSRIPDYPSSILARSNRRSDLEFRGDVRRNVFRTSLWRDPELPESQKLVAWNDPRRRMNLLMFGRRSPKQRASRSRGQGRARMRHVCYGVDPRGPIAVLRTAGIGGLC
jgi:hypothetical protein